MTGVCPDCGLQHELTGMSATCVVALKLVLATDVALIQQAGRVAVDDHRRMDQLHEAATVLLEALLRVCDAVEALRNELRAVVKHPAVLAIKADR